MSSMSKDISFLTVKKSKYCSANLPLQTRPDQKSLNNPHDFNKILWQLCKLVFDNFASIPEDKRILFLGYAQSPGIIR